MFLVAVIPVHGMKLLLLNFDSFGMFLVAVIHSSTVQSIFGIHTVFISV